MVSLKVQDSTPAIIILLFHIGKKKGGRVVKHILSLEGLDLDIVHITSIHFPLPKTVVTWLHLEVIWEMQSLSEQPYIQLKFLLLYNYTEKI